MNPRSVLSWLPRAQRDTIKATARKLRSRAIQLALSYSPSELETALRNLGVADGDAIVMQSAFSPLNGFDGEAQHVIDCILDIIGPRGHLFMLSMPYDGSARDYLSAGNTFDVRRTASQMGIISEVFRRRKSVVRSANPLHPVLAWGPHAEWLVEGHEELPYSCGKGSPFAKMLALETKALLFDVGIAYLTFTHYLEDLFQDSAPVPVYASEPLAAEIIDRAGQRRRINVYPFSKQAMERRNFAVLYDTMLKQDLVRRERIGNTTLQLLTLRSVVDTGMNLVRGGTHIFGADGAPVRVEPTPQGPWRELMAIVREEIVGRRALRDGRKVMSRVLSPLTSAYRLRRLPVAARREVLQDRRGLPGDDPGILPCAAAAIDWLCEAQDRSASNDGGIAHNYSLAHGWGPSYPETTGYIVPTVIEYARRTNDDRLLERSRRMLDWLVSIQLPDGGFQGGTIGTIPVKPTVFNTGQILFGLVAGVATFGDEHYVRAMHRAARWLVSTQDADGCWRAFASPIVSQGEKTYDAHVSAALLEAARIAPDDGYDSAAIRNVRWALTHQRDNGWFGRGCFEEPSRPLTHAIGYVLRGVVEAYRFTGDEQFRLAATKSADALVRAMGPTGFLAGRFRSDWSPAVSWACLTGTSQIAHCLVLLNEYSSGGKYRLAASRANGFVRRTMHLEGPAAVRGGVKGSFPVDGGYFPLEMPNWAAKFTIDANLAELDCPVVAAEPARARETA